MEDLKFFWTTTLLRYVRYYNKLFSFAGHFTCFDSIALISVFCDFHQDSVSLLCMSLTFADT